MRVFDILPTLRNVNQYDSIYFRDKDGKLHQINSVKIDYVQTNITAVVLYEKADA